MNNGQLKDSWINNFTLMQGQPQMQALQDWTRTQPGYENYTPSAATAPTQDQSKTLLTSLYNAPDRVAATAPGATAPEKGVDQGLHDAFQSVEHDLYSGYQDALNNISDPDAAYEEIQARNTALAPARSEMGREIKRQRELYQDKQLNKNDNDFMHKLVKGIAGGALGVGGGAMLGGMLGGVTGGALGGAEGTSMLGNLGQMTGLGNAGEWAGLGNSMLQGSQAGGSSPQQLPQQVAPLQQQPLQNALTEQYAMKRQQDQPQQEDPFSEFNFATG